MAEPSKEFPGLVTRVIDQRLTAERLSSDANALRVASLDVMLDNPNSHRRGFRSVFLGRSVNHMTGPVTPFVYSRDLSSVQMGVAESPETLYLEQDISLIVTPSNSELVARNITPIAVVGYNGETFMATRAANLNDINAYRQLLDFINKPSEHLYVDINFFGKIRVTD